MSEKIDVIHGTDNVFRDLTIANADVRHLKAVLAARIITLLDERGLTVRAAGEATGFAAADFSRIRQVKLDRFTIDRLMGVLNRLGQRVDVDVRITPEPARKTAPKKAA